MGTTQQQSNEDRKRDHNEVRVSRVTNGFTLKKYPDMYVFNTFEEMVEQLRKELNENKPKG